MAELITFGETMLLLTPMKEGPMRYASTYHRGLGGAESNVAIGVQRLGHSSGWFSRIGDDEFGKYILNFVRGEGVDTSRVKVDSQSPTGLYIKERRSSEDVRVTYYRKDSAASRFSPEDLDEDYVAQAKILHITGITPALSDSCYHSVLRSIELARNHGVLISFDPNIRLKLWSMDSTYADGGSDIR